ncbi:MAG: hypothetical protein AAGA91_07330 [Pseudomonadota bacterium]
MRAHSQTHSLHRLTSTLALLVLFGCSDGNDNAIEITDPGAVDPEGPGTVLACDAPAPESPTEMCGELLSLAPSFPGDVAFSPDAMTVEDAQAMFDCLSWKTFVALNWPAKQSCRGTPDTDLDLSENRSLRVWETWKQVFELFQDNDAEWNPVDQDWHDPAPGVACSDVAEGRKIVRMSSKGIYGPDTVTEDEQAFSTSFGVLRDQAGNLVRYEIRFNRDEFEAVRDSGFAATGAYDYGGPLLAASESFVLPDNRTGITGHGSIELKASWKVLTESDDASRYYAQEVVIHDEGGDPECEVQQMGLLGLHIMHKTYHAPQWTFATFEHVDNTPPAGSTGDGRLYTLYDESCALNPPTACWAVQPPISDSSLTCCPNLEFNTGVITDAPTQATRIVPIGPTDLNARYRQLLAEAGSVFQHYQLVNTQFTLGGRDPDNPERVRQAFCNPNGPWSIPAASEDCFTQVPANLRNTSMETYMASYGTGTTELPADSCLNCHAAGGVDSSYIWLDAKLAPVTLR